MPRYRVRSRHSFGKNKQHKAGAVVEMSEIEAAGFLDKLELVEDVAPNSRGGFVVSTPKQAEQVIDLRAAILAASDEELLTLPGVGEKSLSALRDWANGVESTPGEVSTQETGGDDATPPPVQPIPDDAVGKVTVETVKEEPLKTVETVTEVDADAAPTGPDKTKGKPK